MRSYSLVSLLASDICCGLATPFLINTSSSCVSIISLDPLRPSTTYKHTNKVQLLVLTVNRYLDTVLTTPPAHPLNSPWRPRRSTAVSGPASSPGAWLSPGPAGCRACQPTSPAWPASILASGFGWLETRSNGSNYLTLKLK